MNENPLIASVRRGRPTKVVAEQRIYKVTISFTATEYAYFKELAGHEPIPDEQVNSITARPRRRHGSIAGHIRSILQRAKAPLTPAQHASVLQLIEACNTLKSLASRAQSSGLLAVALSLSALQERMNRLLDTVDYQKPIKKHPQNGR